MVRNREIELARHIDAELRSFEQEHCRFPGIDSPERRTTFIEQLIESMRRVDYVSVIRTRDVSPRRGDGNDDIFDPLKAAIHFHRQGELDEAFWMVFLFVHFGKHPQAGYQYASRVYGRLGDSDPWTWRKTSYNIGEFREWLGRNREEIRRGNISAGFGNHRKYQSLDAFSSAGTGATFQTYVEWVSPPRSHEDVVAEALHRVDHEPRKAFRNLYTSMSDVAGFGRVAKFDYLAMLGKLGLVPIIPDSAYLANSSGPLEGARLLFGCQETPSFLDSKLVELDAVLGLGMQVWEDALCNWQKSPEMFLPFRG